MLPVLVSSMYVYPNLKAFLGKLSPNAQRSASYWSCFQAEHNPQLTQHSNSKRICTQYEKYIIRYSTDLNLVHWVQQEDSALALRVYRLRLCKEGFVSQATKFYLQLTMIQS